MESYFDNHSHACLAPEPVIIAEALAHRMSQYSLISINRPGPPKSSAHLFTEPRGLYQLNIRPVAQDIHYRLKCLLGYIPCIPVQRLHFTNGIDTETPQALAQMIPGIQIPVIPIENQAPGRYLSWHGIPDRRL